MKRLIEKLSEAGSSFKLFCEVFLDLLPDMYMHFRWRIIYIAPFVLAASILYLIYKKITD